MITTDVKISPQLEELVKNLKKVDGEVKKQVWTETKSTALEIERQIKEAMPVDTGRAKASWGHFTPEDLAKGAARISKAFKTKTGISKRARFRTAPMANSERAQIAAASDAIWIEDKANLSITQGTLVGYVKHLNEGHARSKPAGFLEVSQEAARIRFEKFGNQLGKMIQFVMMGR